MYLNYLSTKEKELFLDASLLLSESDGSFSDQEKLLVSQLCHEMNISERYTSEKDFDSILADMTNIRSGKSKKIILFELAGIIMADGKCEESEKKLINQIAAVFKMNSIFVDECISIIKTLSGMYELIDKIIMM